MLPTATAPAAPANLARLKVAANHAQVTERTIRRRIADGSLTGYRFGPKLLMVDLAEVDALLRPIPTVSAA